jgi:hypothetical protein
LGALQFIAKDSKISKENKEVVEKEMDALRADVEENIANQFDREKILALM